MRNFRLSTLIMAFAIIMLAAGFNCGTNANKNFDTLLNKNNKWLVQEAAARKDKIYYGQATAAVAFPVFFPLVLPDSSQYVSHKLIKSSFEGNAGQLIVNYSRNGDSFTVYEGSHELEDSPVTTQNQLDLGEEKPNGFYGKQANGNIFVSWGGGDEGMANDSVVYLIKAQGLSKKEIIGIAKKMALYE